MVHGSWLMVDGSWFMVDGSWFMVHGSWLMVHGLGESLNGDILCLCFGVLVEVILVSLSRSIWTLI